MALPAELGARGGGPFVGRATELAALRSAWQHAVGGHRRVVLIGGEPGIGKTRLVGEVASELHRSGATVLHGRCDPDVVFPYQPIAEVFAQLLDGEDDDVARFASARPALGHLVPQLATQDSLRSSDGAAARAALFAASSAVLAHAAARTPLLVVIDDAHWATSPTLLLLRELLRGSVGRSLLIAVTYRDTEVSPRGPLRDLLADLHNETGVERITLAGLDEDAVTDFVRAAGVASDGALVSELVRDTGGNPFFLSQTLRHLADDRSGVAASVRDVIALRVGRLPDETRRCLEAAAVIGPRFELDVLGAIGLGIDALDAVEPAVDARLVVEATDELGQFAFSHELIRQSLLDELGPTRVARLHGQVGQAIELLGAPSRRAEIARHFLRAARSDLLDRGARIALEVAESATWRAAPESSIELADAALDALAQVPDADPDLVVRLHVEKAMALLVLQRNPEFLDTTDRAVDVARRSGSSHLLALAVATRSCYTPTGTTDPRFVTDIEEALAVVDEGDLMVRSRLHSGMAVALLVTNASRRDAFEQAAIAADLADRSGSFFDRWMSRFTGGLAAFGEPDTTNLTRMGAELQALGAEYDDENATCHGLRASAAAQLIHGDLDGYLERAAECERRWRAIHNQWGAGFGITARFIDAAVHGRFAEAEAALNELVPIMATDANFTAIYAGEMVLLRLLQGRRAELEPFVAASVASFPGVFELRIQHAMCRYELGDVDAARATCREVLSDPAMYVPDFGQLSRSGAAVELAVATGCLDLLPKVFDVLLAYEDQLLVVNLGIAVVGPVNRFLGAAAAALGDLERAEAWFASALAWDERNQCEPLAAWTKWWWGQALAAHDRPRAIELLDDAAAICDRLEMPSIAAQARERRSLITSGL